MPLNRAPQMRRRFSHEGRRGCPRGEAVQEVSAGPVELVFKEITDCLERGKTVKLSSFGSFIARTKGPRLGRNLKTGLEVPIAPRRVVVFKASDTLRMRLATVEERTE
jgi:integration host factor subunit alpha